jgi:hypothetical protein
MIRWFSTGSIVGLACTLLAGSWTGAAMAAWPDDRPIEIIVGFQAGSGPDILARRLAPVLARRLGPKASFVVSNRTGAGGEIALAALARAEPNATPSARCRRPPSSSFRWSRSRNTIPPPSCRWRGWWTIRPWWWRAAPARSGTSPTWSRG